MKKYLLHILVIIMTFSLIGIIIVQLFWISNAIEVKESEYEENIREALENIISKIERKSAVIFISENLDAIKIKKPDNSAFINKQHFIEYFQEDSIHHIKSDSVNFISESKIRLNVISSEKDSGEKEYVKLIEESHDNKVTASVHYTDKNANEFIISKDTVYNPDLNKKRSLTTDIYVNVLDDMLIEYGDRNSPIDQKIDLAKLDTLLKKEILEKGFDNDYEYAIIDSKTDTLLKKSEGFDLNYIDKSFKAGLFPYALVDKSIYLYLYLPGKNSFIYNSISFMLLGSIFFTFIIILIFFISIRIAFKQKKISEIKSDFINNMTHEFKTPIATISLAADSIRNSKVIHDENKINHYTGIIKEENRRMNNQVESVLQMSLLEKEKFKINLSEYDIHELIEKALKNIQIQILQKNGKINVALHAENPFVMVDETHFLNIIHNLLDNAIKYSKKAPDIVLTTRNQNGNIIIVVEDNGIGIKKENLVRIFDKFYRVSTGNIHNVKGFGLGLSYVKAIVNEFNGNINATSEFKNLPTGQAGGSRFEVSLPVIPVNNGK
ncbi:MAG: HAMP domain-containing histidine kinase [Bacteroidales bacterium]|nr:HAMP domain-containing histidine kinase [Bacteroidales bacterium]